MGCDRPCVVSRECQLPPLRPLAEPCSHIRCLQIVFLVKDYKRPDQTLGQAVVRAPPFWLVLVMTCSIILPWLRLRKVPVRSEVLSNHCVRLYFDYGEYLYYRSRSAPPHFLHRRSDNIAHPDSV